MRADSALRAALFLVFIAGDAAAISVTPFGPNGAGGASNGQTFSVGAGGSVFELDGFVNIGGLDLNGPTFGTSARLSQDPLPAGLDYTFSSTLSADTTDILLSYTFENNTGGALGNVRFLSLFDADIDEPINSFFNEIVSSFAGVPAPGQNFEADEPGFVFGNIVTNVLNGSLDGTNVFPPPDDVAMALSFDLGALNAGSIAEIGILISEDADSIGNFAMTQADADPASTTQITYSGVVNPTLDASPLPEPGAGLLFTTGVLIMGLRRRARPSSA